VDVLVGVSSQNNFAAIRKNIGHSERLFINDEQLSYENIVHNRRSMPVGTLAISTKRGSESMRNITVSHHKTVDCVYR
jgi:hypothetical protein